MDIRISELEEFLRKSYNSNDIDDDGNFDHDETISSERGTFRPRTSFLHDSTYTLCSGDRFSAFEDDEQENGKLIGHPPIRSNSLDIIQLNSNTVLIEKTPKKVVRFADVLVSFTV